MAAIRRHPTAFGALVLVLVTLTLGWLVWPHPQPAVAGGREGYTPLDRAAASQIATLRQDLALDDDVLACLDLSAEQLETLLSGLRNWHQAHGSEFLSQRREVTDQRTRIRQLESALSSGEDVSAPLTAARQQLAALEAQFGSYGAGVRRTTAAMLSPSQQALVACMIANRDLPMPFRTLQLSPEQKHDLHAALARHRQRMAAAQLADHPAIKSEYQQALQAAIGPAGVQALATLDQTLGPASERVAAAVQAVLSVADRRPG